jgi:hypothetical protein
LGYRLEEGCKERMDLRARAELTYAITHLL